jgi:hypothetical protein
MLPMERVTVARMATVKPQGWVQASLGMGSIQDFYYPHPKNKLTLANIISNKKSSSSTIKEFDRL